MEGGGEEKGPTAAAKRPESSEKYDGELNREEEGEEERRRRKIKRRENPSEVLNCVNTDLQRRTDKLMLRDIESKPAVKIQQFSPQCHIYWNF